MRKKIGSDGLIGWWWERINIDKHWRDMSEAEQVAVVKNIRGAAKELLGIELDKSETATMIKATSVIQVFDAILKSLILSNQSNKEALKKYVKTIIINEFKDSRKVRITYHKEIRDPHRSTGPSVSLETVRRYDPFNRRVCSDCGLPLLPDETDICRYCREKRVTGSSCQYCGRKLQKNNQTGICTKCQSKGRKQLGLNP